MSLNKVFLRNAYRFIYLPQLCQSYVEHFLNNCIPRAPPSFLFKVNPIDSTNEPPNWTKIQIKITLHTHSIYFFFGSYFVIWHKIKHNFTNKIMKIKTFAHGIWNLLHVILVDINVMVHKSLLRRCFNRFNLLNESWFSPHFVLSPLWDQFPSRLISFESSSKESFAKRLTLVVIIL